MFQCPQSFYICDINATQQIVWTKISYANSVSVLFQQLTCTIQYSTVDTRYLELGYLELFDISKLGAVPLGISVVIYNYYILVYA